MTAAFIIKVLLILVGGGIGLYIAVSVARFLKKTADNTSDLIKTIKQVTDETATTPRTISGMEPAIIQRVKRDFPDFNIEVGREMVKNAITYYFAALNGDPPDMRQLESVCTHALAGEILSLNGSDSIEYDMMRIHKIAASNYVKRTANATITFQAAVEYKRPNKSLMQYVYESELEFYFSEDNEGAVTVARCNYCGGELEEKGGKLYCKYCGSPVESKMSEERWWRVNSVSKAR